MTEAIQLLTAFLGAIGFSLLFHVRGRLILPASIGGMLEWGVYLLGLHTLDGIFLPCLIASAFSAVYAEVMARLLKAPATVFFLPTIVPLIPGSTLYYMMHYAVQSDWAMARYYRGLTIQYALGIAAGISLVWAVVDMLHKVRAKNHGGDDRSSDRSVGNRRRF